MGRKESAGNQAGTARMTVGDRFWARRIRPIFDDGDLTLEQKSVFCCIVARDPMSVAIECPARDIAAAEAGLPRRDYDEALDALERGGYIVDIVTPYGEDRDGELCMVPIPAEVVRVGSVKCVPADDLDQQDLPDIVNQRISELEARLSRLEAEKQGEFPPDKKE